MRYDANAFDPVLEDEVASGVFSVGATLAVLALASIVAMSVVALRRHGALVRALAAGERDVEPEDIARLATLPTQLSVRFFAAASMVMSLVLVPGIRPERLDSGRAVSLFILAMTILAGAALPTAASSANATNTLYQTCSPPPASACGAVPIPDFPGPPAELALTANPL